ncbi:MAG TPA: NAD(P)/FAD-dependent oxidoreductase [Candidatus Acidoferrales bacterium]|nr:NAD(P)/FAD-dependent oxidoreductase [Candidatus Acidoferrales bacterium]
MTRKFDLVAIGTGSAASAVTSRCRAAGWQVAIVDSRPFGGTCALRGCDPKKVVVGAADALDWIRRMKGKGIQFEKVQIEWQELMRFKRSFTEPVPKNREEGFAKAGITAFHGRARFMGPSTVQVGGEVLEGRYVVVAAGQKPADLKIPGTEHLTTSEQFLELNELPKRILFIGGGYIAFEFAHVAVRAGSQVTIVHRGARPLPLFDPGLVDQIVRRTRELGVDVQLGTEVIGVEESSGQLIVLASSSGEKRTFEAGMVVHAAGRVPEIDDLDLHAAGVEWTKGGVTVNEFLQSVSNPAVYAACDAAASGGPPLTPVASYDGIIVAANLLKGNHQKPNYLGIPTVVFTIPPLAAVGLGESGAREQGLKFSVNKEMTSSWYSSRKVGETNSGFKVLVEEGTDRILGAHLLGGQAEEVINLFAVAMRSGMRAADLKHMLFAYPTHGSDVPYML